MVIGVLASMAESERELVKERTALQRETSRANGTKFGRPRNDAEHIATATRMKADGHTAKDIAKYLGMSGVVSVPDGRHRLIGRSVEVGRRPRVLVQGPAAAEGAKPHQPALLLRRVGWVLPLWLARTELLSSTTLGEHLLSNSRLFGACVGRGLSIG